MKVRFIKVLRKQSFLALSHPLMQLAKCFHFFKKQGKTKLLSIKYKREQVYVRIIQGTLQKYGCQDHTSELMN